MTTAHVATERAPGPDIARGAALAIVAMSNTIWWIYAGGVDASLVLSERVEAWTEAFDSMFITGRAYPMFSFLFGYAIVQALASQKARGSSDRAAENRVLGRNALLLGFGAVHATLLFSGDVLGAYGVLGFFVLMVALQSQRTVLTIAVGTLLFRLIYDHYGLSGAFFSGGAFYDVAASQSYFGSIGMRLTDWVQSIVSLPYYLAPMLFGVWAARLRMLEDPERHRRALVLVVVTGFALSVLGGLPMVLFDLGSWYPAGDATWIYSLQSATGIAGGLALAALCGLLALWAASSRVVGAIVEPLRCLGRRSLSGYLFQSLAFLLIFPAYTFGIGAEVDTTAAYLIALAVWALTVALAVLLDRTDRPGPAEWLMHKLL